MFTYAGTLLYMAPELWNTEGIPMLLISGRLVLLCWSCLPARTSRTTDQAPVALRLAKQGIAIGFVHLSYRVETKRLYTSRFSMAYYLWTSKHAGWPANVSNGLSVTSASFNWKTHPGSRGIATLAACTLLYQHRWHHLFRTQSRGVVVLKERPDMDSWWTVSWYKCEWVIITEFPSSVEGPLQCVLRCT